MSDNIAAKRDLSRFVHLKAFKVKKETQRSLFLVICNTGRYKTFVEGTSLVKKESTGAGSEWKSWAAAGIFG